MKKNIKHYKNKRKNTIKLIKKNRKNKTTKNYNKKRPKNTKRIKIKQHLKHKNTKKIRIKKRNYPKHKYQGGRKCPGCPPGADTTPLVSKVFNEDVEKNTILDHIKDKNH